MTKLSNPIRIWAALFLLIAGTCLPVMAQQTTADNWTISAQTTPAQCESDVVPLPYPTRMVMPSSTSPTHSLRKER